MMGGGGSGENEANVAFERVVGGAKKRERAKCLSEEGRRRCSMTENPVFSISSTDCDWALFTAPSLHPISTATVSSSNLSEGALLFASMNMTTA